MGFCRFFFITEHLSRTAPVLALPAASPHRKPATGTSLCALGSRCDSPQWWGLGGMPCSDRLRRLAAPAGALRPRRLQNSARHASQAPYLSSIASSSLQPEGIYTPARSRSTERCHSGYSLPNSQRFRRRISLSCSHVQSLCSLSSTQNAATSIYKHCHSSSKHWCFP